MVTWTAALLLEGVLLGLSASVYTSPHYEYNSLRPNGQGEWLEGPSQTELVEICCDAVRVLLLALSVAFFVLFWLQLTSSRRSAKGRGSDESAPLLGHAISTGGIDHVQTNGHGTFDGPGRTINGNSNVDSGGGLKDADSRTNGSIHGGGRKAPDETAAFYRPTSAPARSWWEYIRGYSLFFPYLWPSKSVKLQLVLLICFLLVMLQRVVNFLVPYQAGKVVNLLAPEDDSDPDMPYLQISLFIVFKLLQGPSGILGAIRSALWIPVAQYSYKALSTASFEHVHGLSLDFHLAKRTGEVISALSKGGAINTFLEQVTFQVLPMLFDVITAIIYLQAAFDAYYTLTLTIVTCLYLYLTVRLAQWRAEQRRTMINLDREEDAVKNDSLQSYETVKYFGAEDYEFGRYRGAVTKKQGAETAVMLSLNVMNITQNMVFMAGLLVVSFIAAYQVTTGQRKVGAFVTLLTYFQQLQGPLNFFGTFYRSVQSAMISGERLLELFKEQPTVEDKPEAHELITCSGEITFDAVKFAYDERKPALKDLSFTCAPGTTTALVGESGGGKSTIFRLLFRFYNVQDGRILIDGQSTEDLTLQSLRSHIGVVPQDTILFNETLMYNLKYANQDATEQEVYAACRAASIHDKILAFPDGYNTKVGERGLRLSGGEKQRVAIARTILKDPRIIMLDEATAALDSETEQNIQEALQTLSRGRTMLVIA